MYDVIDGDCWNIISEWNDDLVSSEIEVEGSLMTGYFPDDEVLAASLLDVYNLGEGE